MVSVIGICGIIAATIGKLKFQIEGIEMLYGYSSIFVILMASGIFYLVQNIKINTENKLWKLVEVVDECSFGIYILHMVIVRLVLRYWKFNPYEGISIIRFIGLLIITFAVSFGVTWCLRKIHVVKIIV